MSADAKWYVVHTYSGYENKVATNIEKWSRTVKCRIRSLRFRSPPRSSPR